MLFGLDDLAYRGGYYLGEIICPENYPASAPKINVLTHNGRLVVSNEGICMSISHHHQESWNPAWKVNQIVVGLLSMWLGRENTYGAISERVYKKNKTMSREDQIISQYTRKSR